MPYSPTVYVNGTTPAINATDLNKLRNELISQATAKGVTNTLGSFTWANGIAPYVSHPTNAPAELNEMERVAAAVATTLSLTYSRTTWSAAWVPARNATNLNKLENAAQANRAAIDGATPTFQNAVLTINAGGVYDGNVLGNFERTNTSGSFDNSASVVIINTPSAVTIQNMRIRQLGQNNQSPMIWLNNPFNLTLDHCYFYGALTPSTRIINADSWSNFTMRNCTIDRSAGCSMGAGLAGCTFLVTKNRHTNVNKMNATIGDTNGQFIQVRDTTGAASMEISWNEILNTPELVWSEDLISIINCGGVGVNIHDNYIDHISSPNFQSCTQGAVTIESSSNNQIRNNQIVDAPANIGFYAGTGNVATGNRMIQDGYYPDGVHRIVEGFAGCYVAPGTGSMSSNVTGYVQQDGTRNDFDYRSDNYSALLANNTILSSPITRQMELAELPIWQNKLSANGITIGA